MEFDKILEKRFSTRSFKGKAAPFGKVLEAIYSSLQGPFAGNYNNLKFLIVESPETIKKIAHHCQQTWISESKLLVLICSEDTILENHYGERGRVYSRQQAGAVISTLLLKLTDMGIDSCWVGSYSDDLIKQMLEIPQHIQIEAIIPTGFASKKLQKSNKKSLENVLYWEKWKKNKRPAFFKEKPDKIAIHLD